MCNKAVLTNLGFIVENIGRALDCLVISIPALYIPSLIGKNELDSSSYLALTVLGAANLGGRLLSAVVDEFAQHVTKANALMSFGTGVSAALLAHCQSPLWFYVVCGCCGFFTGPMVALMPLTDATIVGKDNISSALGISQLVYGVMCLLGKPQFAIRPTYLYNELEIVPIHVQ